MITHIIILSIQQNKFPQNWKYAKIVPLHKKDEKNLPKNYRPVALLPIFSKILEKAVFLQMIEYLEQNGLLHPSHHGFRKSHNTCSALLNMYDYWIDAMEEKKISAVVLLDMSAAFDVVDHALLINKMKIYGFKENMIKWTKSYLTNRYQQVFIDGYLSKPLSVEAGVPQGSILGPLLYVLFTNDLPEAVHDHENEDLNGNCNSCGSVCCYADDTTYSKSHKDPVVLKQQIDQKYQKLSEYMNQNKLILNKDKTHLLIMAPAKKRKNKNNFGITLNTGEEIIKPQDTEVLLGGVISSNLKWNEHIRDHKKSMLKSLTSRINALSKISKFSNFKTRKMIANGIFMSKLVYLIQLWGGTNEYLLTFLQKLQNRAARLVTKLGWYTPIKTLLLQCGWLSVRQLVIYHSSILIYKSRQMKQPLHLYKIVSKQFLQNTRLGDGDCIKQDKTYESKLGEFNFSNRAVQDWNILPAEIRQAPTLQVFKSSLKKWIKTHIPIK